MNKIGVKFLFAFALLVPFAAPLLRGSEPLIVGQPSRPDDERTIREFENQNALAVLHLDYAALERLWSERFVVSTPANSIAPNRAAVFELFRKSNGPMYSSYEKKIECIVFNGDVTIVMGVETVVPRNAPMETQTGSPVQRRFTNIWKFENDTWRLIARQATIVPTSASPRPASEDPAAKRG
jgi:ketosteroid isomerase-like protein